MSCTVLQGAEGEIPLIYLPCEKPEIKYRFVYENCEYPVTKWAAMLEFSTSGYYDWLKNKEQRDKKQQDYEEAITNIFVDSYCRKATPSIRGNSIVTSVDGNVWVRKSTRQCGSSGSLKLEQLLE